MHSGLHGASFANADPTESPLILDALRDVDRGQKWMPVEISGAFSAYICVVIADDEIAEETVRQCLDTVLPIYVTRWHEQDYLADIRALCPRIIVVMGKEDLLAQEQADLVATLFTREDPTVISGALSARPGLGCHLVLHRLGSGAKARVDSIRDVLLLPN